MHYLKVLFFSFMMTVAGIELAERICVMGISMNLVTYLVGNLHISSAKSANIVTNFMGTLNLLGLLGGFLADAKLGRYLTVARSATITAVVSFEPRTIRNINLLTNTLKTSNPLFVRHSSKVILPRNIHLLESA